MEGEKILKIGDFTIKCREYYGYNDHYYVTLFDDTDNQCAYLTQLTDCHIRDGNFEKRVAKYVEENM